MTLKPIHPNEPVTEDGKKPSRVLIEVIQRLVSTVDSLSLSGGGGVWGAITGTIGAQTDLQTALGGKSNTGHTHTASEVADFSEAVDDRVSALLTAGTNVTLTYNDGAGTLTIDAAGGGGGNPAIGWVI